MRKLDEQPIYYVYFLFDWCGIPRWVGKGKNGRIDAHGKYGDTSNSLKIEMIEQTWIMLDDLPKLKVQEGLTEKQAFDVESILIKAIGRKDLGTGPLLNLTDGGEGLSGFVYSEFSKNIRSEVVTRIHAARTPAERSAIIAKGLETLGPEGRSARAHKRESAMTFEARSRRALDRDAKMPPEKRRERALKGAAAQTAEQRSAKAVKANLGRSDEQLNKLNTYYQSLSVEERSSLARKGHKNQSSVKRMQRIENIRKSILAIPFEVRSANSKKADLQKRLEGLRKGREKVTPQLQSLMTAHRTMNYRAAAMCDTMATCFLENQCV